MKRHPLDKLFSRKKGNDFEKGKWAKEPLQEKIVKAYKVTKMWLEQNMSRLQSTVGTAEKITGTKPSILQDLYIFWVMKQVWETAVGPS